MPVFLLSLFGFFGKFKRWILLGSIIGALSFGVYLIGKRVIHRWEFSIRSEVASECNASKIQEALNAERLVSESLRQRNKILESSLDSLQIAKKERDALQDRLNEILNRPEEPPVIIDGKVCPSVENLSKNTLSFIEELAKK